jgi:hypothetical protein
MFPVNDGCSDEIEVSGIVKGWKGHGYFYAPFAVLGERFAWRALLWVATPPPKTAAGAWWYVCWAVSPLPKKAMGAWVGYTPPGTAAGAVVFLVSGGFDTLAKCARYSTTELDCFLHDLQIRQ